MGRRAAELLPIMTMVVPGRDSRRTLGPVPAKRVGGRAGYEASGVCDIRRTERHTLAARLNGCRQRDGPLPRERGRRSFGPCPRYLLAHHHQYISAGWRDLGPDCALL